MQDKSIHRPTVLNVDKAFSDLTPNESYFIQNHTSLLNVNGIKGNNFGNGKPRPSNYQACSIDQPAGEVYTVGGYRSPLTKEIYSWHINSNGVHYILRTKETGCQIVYQLGCLDLSAEPRNSIENWRAFLHIEKICANRHGKYLMWTNGIGDIHYLDVEAAIATNFFTTTFFDRCPDECALINLCVPKPCDCLKGSFIPFKDADIHLNNFILDKPFQFIYKHIYYDGRESEWSEPSTPLYQASKGCNLASGLSRGIKLRIPVGNPLVDKIAVAYTNGRDIWFQFDTIDKYKKYNNSQEKWYDRSLAPLSNYSDIDCAFDYEFFNDKQKFQIDSKKVNRVYNPIPRDVQGFIPIKQLYGFYNYVQGTCPVDKKEIEKFNIGIDCSNRFCTPEYVTVKVRAIILNINENLAGFVFREGISGEEDDPDKPAYFGSQNHDLSDGYGQKFTNKTRNFIAYVEGSPYWAEMKQWKARTGFVSNTETGVVSVPVDENIEFPVGIIASGVRTAGEYYYQEAIITVPKGTRGAIRITGHAQNSGSGDNQNTSTNTIGVVMLPYYQNGHNHVPVSDMNKHEVWFDTCNGSVELTQGLLIQDDAADGDEGSAYNGYLKDADDKPIAGANIQFQGSGNVSSTTDHNGFYHFYKGGADNADIDIKVEQNCSAFSTIRSLTITGAEKATTRTDFTITENDYEHTFYATVTVPVQDCSGNAVQGVRVVLSGSKYSVTDINGIATFKVRNIDDRNILAISAVLNENGCFISDCSNGCQPCMPSHSQALPACFINEPEVPFPVHTINTSNVINESNGLKAGGVYEWAIVLEGKCGRISSAYPVKTMTIPKTQEKGYMGFCSFTYDATGIQLPDWVSCLKILRSTNLNNYELQWKVDKIEKISGGKLRLTVQSLNDYNLFYGLKTNTTYQWLDGDRIEFIRNGDGKIIDTAQKKGLLNYVILNPFHDVVLSGKTDAAADYFNQIIINDDGRLDDIVEGATIELLRPVEPQQSTIYSSICANIDVVNGQPLVPIGTFTSFDTYFVNRVIETSNQSFTGTFEHFAPSDFWIDRLSDAGRRYVANNFENERRYGRYITMNDATNLAYFGDLVKRFDAPGQGDITAMHIVDDKIIVAICENDNFLSQTADELVRVGGDGIIRAATPDQIIAEGEPKIYGAYGCQYDDIGSVFFGDGFSTYVDSNKRLLVHHDYQAANNASLGKTESYFRIKCQEKEHHNLSQSDAYNKFRWSTGLNFSTNEVFLTLKTLRHSSTNNDSNPYSKKNVTLIYFPAAKEFLGFASFTPEYYSQIDLSDADGCEFVAFSQGQPYVHPIIATTFNNFFGVQCDERFAITVNKNKNKVKRMMAMEVKSPMMWFAEEITNGNANFVSEIPPVKFDRENDKWGAKFLFNRNSRAGLYGNSKDRVEQDTRGEYVNIMMCRDNTDNRKYKTLDNAKRALYNESGDVLVKFAYVEQTGFDVNL